MNPSDYSAISFPSLGIEVNPGRGFSVGPLSVNYYGMIIAFGLLLAVLYGWKRSKKFGFKEDDILDGVLWVTPFAIICARAYYCIFQWEIYASNPISVFHIWKGGLAIYGGVLGALIGVSVYCWIKRLRLPALLDLVSLGFLIGQSIGRWGNFFNREAYGEVTKSFFRMGLMNKVTGMWEYYHPTFLYESVWNAVGFLLLHLISKRRKYDGQIALCYVAWYGLGRYFIEGLRLDSLMIGSFRVSQLLAGGSCVLAVIALIVLQFLPHRPLFAKRMESPAPQQEAAPSEDEADPA